MQDQTRLAALAKGEVCVPSVPSFHCSHIFYGTLLPTYIISRHIIFVKVSKQHKELACIMLREFRSHPEVESQFHELREEHVQFIASFLQESLRAEQYEPMKDVHVIARMLLYNLIVIGIIEDATEPLHFVENMVDILLCRLGKNV